MAHHKRKKPRTRGTRHGDMHFHGWPAWWDIVFHTRPTRAKNREALRRIFKGDLDHEDHVFLNGKKPHIYYW